MPQGDTVPSVPGDVRAQNRHASWVPCRMPAAGWLHVFALILALCGCSEAPIERPVNPLVAPYLSRPGGDPAGGNAVVVYLSLHDGRVIEGPGRGAGTPWTQIRLLVRVGSQLPSVVTLPADSDTRNEGGGFERIIRPNLPGDQGILHFSGPCGTEVFASQSYGDDRGRAHFLAEMQVGGGVHLQYLYGAQNRADHHRYADWVYRWYRANPDPCANAASSLKITALRPMTVHSLQMDAVEDHGTERFRV